MGKSNSDFAGDKVSRKLVTGWMVFFFSVLNSWKSKAQGHVTLSSLEAEVVALSDFGV